MKPASSKPAVGGMSARRSGGTTTQLGVVSVGEHIKRLVAAGLLVQHHKGFVANGKSHPSVYEVVTLGSSHEDEVRPGLAATAK